MSNLLSLLLGAALSSILFLIGYLINKRQAKRKSLSDLILLVMPLLTEINSQNQWNIGTLQVQINRWKFSVNQHLNFFNVKENSKEYELLVMITSSLQTTLRFLRMPVGKDIRDKEGLLIFQCLDELEKIACPKQNLTIKTLSDNMIKEIVFYVGMLVNLSAQNVPQVPTKSEKTELKQ